MPNPRRSFHLPKAKPTVTTTRQAQPDNQLTSEPPGGLAAGSGLQDQRASRTEGASHAGATAQILIRGVTKQYSTGTIALTDVNLSVSDREFVTIVGPSGCGKSTMLRMIAGLGAPTAGELLVHGMPPTKARENPGTLSYVFQEPTLMPWRRVLENVMLPLEFLGIDKTERRNRAQEALDQVGLAQQARSYPRELSGGMKMRVSIARAMVVSPRLLLMDEPFGALDEITRQKLNGDLQEIYSRSHVTVCFVTHNVFEAVFMSTRVMVMTAQPGRICGEVSIPYAYPRNPQFRLSPEFMAASQQVTKLLDPDS